MTTDPVCKMQVDEKKSAAKTEHRGQTYHFCSDECRKKFEQHPEKYTTRSAGS